MVALLACIAVIGVARAGYPNPEITARIDRYTEVAGLLSPLLAFALPLDRRLWIPLGVVSFTCMMNLLLFDSVTLIPFANAFGLQAPGVRAISIAIALLNTLTLVGMIALFWKHSAREEQPA